MLEIDYEFSTHKDPLEKSGHVNEPLFLCYRTAVILKHRFLYFFVIFFIHVTVIFHEQPMSKHEHDPETISHLITVKLQHNHNCGMYPNIQTL